MQHHCVHLMIDSYVRYSLQNLIGENKGHKIFIVKKNVYFDIDKNEIPSYKVEQYLQDAEVIFAHFLNHKIAQLINNLHDSKKVVWFCWGGDLYNLGKFGNQFLQSKTKKLYYKFGFRSFDIFKNILKESLGKYIDYIPPNKEVLSAIKKANIIVPVVPGDYENLKDSYNIKAEVFNLNYINNVFFKQPKLNRSKPRRDILLGNSASFTNNHVEAIDLLSNYDLKDAKVHIPLTYGRAKYANFINKYALDKLGANANIFEERLPLDDYMDFFANCKSVIMNHCRQQAMGNIFLAFWFETSLYLNPGANHYQVLTKRGFKVLNVSDFDPETELTEEDKKQNKALLVKWYGPDYLQNRFNKLLEYLDVNSSN